MRWHELPAEALTADAATAWAAAPRASVTGDGAVVTAGPHAVVVGPTDAVSAWLAERYGAEATAVAELACFVYRHKGWFAPELDPLALRDRRAGQVDVRVFTEVAGRPVPLLAIDLAPVRHAGTFATIDQRRPNGAASLTEIARVPADQPVVVAGHERALGSLACGTDRLWEASRLASLTELRRPAASADVDATGGPMAPVLDAWSQLDEGEAATAAAAGRALFGTAIAWSIASLPIDAIVGLSQGAVVRTFTALMTGGDRRYRPLRLDGWHPDAAALAYAPGYFATGQVQGYALDAVGMLADMLPLAVQRFARLATAPAREP